MLRLNNNEKDKNMKNKKTIFLTVGIPSIAFFLWSVFDFITIATANEVVVWKFVALLISVLIFGFFVLALLREFLKKTSNSEGK